MQETPIKFIKPSDTEKVIILRALGFEKDKDGMIIDKSSNTKHICPISKKEVMFNTAAILPNGSEILVINTSELTLSEYFFAYREKNEQQQVC